MESVEARAPSLLDHIWSADVHGGASSDDSFVEDLLNFSFADEEPEVEEKENKCFISASSETQKLAHHDNDKGAFVHEDEITFPVSSSPPICL